MGTTNSSEPDRLAGILGRVALGDRTAFQVLYQATASRLYPVALRVLGERSLAEDALQEAFVAIWHHAGRYRSDRGAPLAWLASLVRFKALDIARARPSDLPLEICDGDGNLRSHDAAHDGPTPEQALLARCDDERLRHCLGQLDDAPRRAVLMSFYEGLTHQELAARLAHPLGTVKAWIRRSLQRLQTCLEA